ncbi:regulation of nuclear pre-mRNA domain-containing protein 1B isoform X1 [Anguilla anguilla]|uniref:CID domain-containing protein n=1 Tax=Anguilla anguilla TaxID=7936 RepID=A0A9D3RP88_ANGAN|nr:regulation of nuclear pre-mRNA domain-containing protein 1B isoform X1 [Anguilla anguilla]XP_035237300.1 regulation of nuclear pre-mRNA domain-containing protein 1B isoform X1 [Anguilla anguilla]XP_035237301.1 regulation of nuclear pre-mRNA domain-containing protein 1B isoform X1 [Anguilla anguilla]XP_035237302.1 regulation of nuclear pre-mRNA domain-containing protein 1B isoform X1 [Anguilla anguilla]XP_035237303.1 regulation of nuclear pre-mRNA domain-containing protein 1B isoform X1 [Angu
MSSFSESALEKKLSELSNSQQSVQTLSLWIIHHRKHASLIVRVWHRELKKAKRSRKLTFLYLANDVIQNSKKKGPEFTRDFEGVLVDACSHVASYVFSRRESDDGSKKHMERLLNIWQERNLYRSDFIQQLKLAIEDSNSPRHKPSEEKKAVKRSYQKVQEGEEEEEEEEDDDYRGHFSPRESDSTGPQLTEELVKALQDLENAASGDAAVRQKIASLPQEVQDVSLLEKITDKEAAESLSKTVDEACLLLAEYNGRLAAELEDRRQLARMLTEYIHSQREALSEREKKLEEYKQKLARVTQVRKELKSHIQSLPDLSLLPNVTGGLAPLPSAGDLFSTD